MTPLQAAMDRVRRVRSVGQTWGPQFHDALVTVYHCNCWEDGKDRFDADLSILADAYLALHPVATAMLDVLTELQESASYWSEYDVPCGIADRINTAVESGRKALNITE